jgi:hypothetical protein
MAKRLLVCFSFLFFLSTEAQQSYSSLFSSIVFGNSKIKPVNIVEVYAGTTEAEYHLPKIAKSIFLVRKLKDIKNWGLVLESPKITRDQLTNGFTELQIKNPNKNFFAVKTGPFKGCYIIDDSREDLSNIYLYSRIAAIEEGFLEP